MRLLTGVYHPHTHPLYSKFYGVQHKSQKFFEKNSEKNVDEYWVHTYPAGVSMNGTVKILFNIDREKREQIKTIARVTGVRLSEMYRQIFEKGFSEVEELEKLEPLKNLR